MARGTHIFGARTRDSDGALLALLGGAALAAASAVVLLGLAEVVRLLHALPLHGGAIF